MLPWSLPMKHRDALKLVIADDSHAIQSALANDIDGMNHILLAGQAFDVPQAIERIHQTGADVVILDMNMPGGSGLDVLKGLSKNGARPVCIVFSFHLVEVIKDCCTRLGAHACLRKPEDSEMLIAALTAMKRGDLDALRTRTLSLEHLAGRHAAEIAGVPQTSPQR